MSLIRYYRTIYIPPTSTATSNTTTLVSIACHTATVAYLHRDMEESSFSAKSTPTWWWWQRQQRPHQKRPHQQRGWGSSTVNSRRLWRWLDSCQLTKIRNYNDFFNCFIWSAFAAPLALLPLPPPPPPHPHPLPTLPDPSHEMIQSDWQDSLSLSLPPSLTDT